LSVCEQSVVSGVSRDVCAFPVAALPPALAKYMSSDKQQNRFLLSRLTKEGTSHVEGQAKTDLDSEL